MTRRNSFSRLCIWLLLWSFGIHEFRGLTAKTSAPAAGAGIKSGTTDQTDNNQREKVASSLPPVPAATTPPTISPSSSATVAPTNKSTGSPARSSTAASSRPPTGIRKGQILSAIPLNWQNKSKPEEEHQPEQKQPTNPTTNAPANPTTYARPTDAPTSKLQALYESDKGLQISRNHRTMFVHIPKTGGSSIEQSKLFLDKQQRPAGEKIYRPAGHAHIPQFVKQEGVSNFTSFAIVRHPCERFLSAFHYMAKGGRNGMDQSWANKNIGNLTLDEWVQRGIRDSYFHFEPMWKFTFLEDAVIGSNSNRMGVDRIFCQEQFSQATDWVNSHLGCSIFPEVPHKNPGSHGSCQELKEDTRKLVEEFYALDYCVFGYHTGRNETSSEKEAGCVAERISKQEFSERFRACCSAANLHW